MARPRRPLHRAVLSARERLLFEAGIKLGGIFHQYLGIPVSSRTADALARTIESAVGLQPFVVAARVTIVPRRAGPMGRGRFAYRYLTAEMIDAQVTLVEEPVRVVARLRYRPDLRYPLMGVEAVGNSHRAGGQDSVRRRARRSERTRGPSGRRRARSAG
jgi:hypothetical protein